MNFNAHLHVLLPQIEDHRHDQDFHSTLFWSNEVRLTKQQTHTIIQTVYRLAGTGAAVYLFGSRLNDQTKGGDIACSSNPIRRYR